MFWCFAFSVSLSRICMRSMWLSLATNHLSHSKSVKYEKYRLRSTDWLKKKKKLIIQVSYFLQWIHTAQMFHSCLLDNFPVVENIHCEMIYILFVHGLMFSILHTTGSLIFFFYDLAINFHFSTKQRKKGYIFVTSTKHRAP